MNKVDINEILHNLLINEIRTYNNYVQVLMHPENFTMEDNMSEEKYMDFVVKIKTALINISKTANKIASDIKFMENEKYIPPKLIKKLDE